MVTASPWGLWPADGSGKAERNYFFERIAGIRKKFMPGKSSGLCFHWTGEGGRVGKADAYVGIFAHRYGYVPENHNPELCSITELENLQAGKCGKPALVFLLSEDAPWHPKYMDAVTGEGTAGSE